MTWRIFLTDSSQPDLEKLSPADRAAITDDLFAWVPNGPPRTKRQVVAGVQLFEDQLPSGISVTYYVDEQVPYVGVVRVRRRLFPSAEVPHSRSLASAVGGAPNARDACRCGAAE